MPCGFHTHARTECTCSPSVVARYQRRISGPLLDRIDVFVEVPPVEYDKLVNDDPASASAQLFIHDSLVTDVSRRLS